jgi:putative oxidoreductase
MFARLSRRAPEILGVIRILVGILLASHGAQKFGAFGGVPAGVPGFIIWIAGPIELVGGALLALGLFTRGTAFLTSGLMAFAYFLGHAGKGFWPILNGGELAIVYSWLSLYLAAQGPGAWAFDNSRRRAGEGPGPAVHEPRLAA